MIISISHWGMFRIPLAGTDNFNEVLSLGDVLAGRANLPNRAALRPQGVASDKFWR